MQKALKSFYEENKEVIEITTILFVVCALFLNVPESSGLSNIAIVYIQFSFLLIATCFLTYLTSRALDFFGNIYGPLVDQESEKFKNTNPKKELYALTKGLAVLFFPVLLAILIIANLGIYIVSTYPAQSLFLILTVVIYFVGLWICSLIPKSSGTIYGVFMIALILLFFMMLPILLHFYLNWMNPSLLF